MKNFIIYIVLALSIYGCNSQIKLNKMNSYSNYIKYSDLIRMNIEQYPVPTKSKLIYLPNKTQVYEFKVILQIENISNIDLKLFFSESIPYNNELNLCPKLYDDCRINMGRRISEIPKIKFLISGTVLADTLTFYSCQPYTGEMQICYDRDIYDAKGRKIELLDKHICSNKVNIDIK